MCGLSGIYSKRGAPDDALVLAMTDRLTHRGPIEDGYYNVPPVSLGMRRLSIVDIEGGHQPVYNEDRSIAVMLNGQIYNYIELADELQARGHRLYTRSDTEVIAHLYEELGPACLERFNGMFVIVLWDAGRQELFVARDRLGVKPLYYADGPEYFAYASELKSLLLCPFVPREIDPAAIAEYLTLMYIRAPRTPFRGVAKLLPGHYLLVGQGGVRTQRWWNLSEHCQPADLTLPQAEDRLGELLSDAVRLRLRSDVPVGAFLSGGIDSSAVTAFAARHLPHPVNTYAVGFAGDGFDELGYAQLVADAFGTRHHATTVKVEDAIQHLPLLAWHLDEPHGDSAIVPTYLVSQVAAQELRVVLSGLGGDELFGGYARYFDGYPVEHLYRRFPLWMRRPLPGPLSPVLGPRLADRLQTNNLPDAERYLGWVRVFSDDLRCALLGARANTPVTLQDEFNAYPSRDAVNRMMFVDGLTYLPDDILHLTDRMSMAVSLEARTPFLDYRLVELAASLPGHYKVDQIRRLWKICLKESLAPILPAAILARPKWGFGAPVTAWMRQGLLPTLRALLRDPASARWGMIDAQSARAYVDQAAAEPGRFAGSQRLWTLLMLELWARVFLDEKGERPAFTLADLSA